MGAAKCVIAPNEGRAGGAGAVTLAGTNGCGLCRSMPTGPGAYEFTYWTRPVDVKGEIGVRGGVEFYDKDGKFVHPYFYATPQGAPDAFGWYKVVIKIPRMPEKAARVSIFLQVAPGSTGIAYFDDVSLRPAVSPLLAVMTSPRNQTAAPGDEVRIRIVHENGDGLGGGPECQAIVSSPGKIAELRLHMANDAFTFVVPDLPDGPCPLTIAFTNAPAGTVPVTLPMNVLKRARRTTFDEHGRMFIDGRPFMPLGFFSSGGANERERKCMKESGANVYLTYCSFGGLGWNLADVKKTIADLDAMGVKTIFSLTSVYPGIRWTRKGFDGVWGYDAVVDYMVKGLRGEPGLLAWYLNDELSFSEMVVRRRDRVSALDPDHPALSEVYQVDVAPAFHRTTDVFGMCCYPVNVKPVAETSIPLPYVEGNCAAFGAEGNPLWGVPQMFCSNGQGFGGDARTPTEDEMRSIALHFAGLGVRGFIFYNLTDLWRKNLLPDGETAFARHWPEVCRVFAFLKSFEPWVMSSKPVQRLPDDKMSAKGNVRVYRFRDDGSRDRIIFIGCGPGESEVKVRLPGKWRSLFGKTDCASEECVFRSVGISSDVLEQQ